MQTVSPDPTRADNGATSGDRLDTAVRRIMRAGVVTISEQASLRQALRAMTLHDVHAVLVTGRGGAPVGWITERGLLDLADADPDLLSARTAVNEAVVRIHPTTTAREALQLLQRAETSHLLVAHADDVAPEGVVSAIDIIRLIAR